MITKPINLIVANKMHEVVEQIAVVDRAMQSMKSLANKAGIQSPPVSAVSAEDHASDIARSLLCAIAHSADMAKVYSALAAVGAPKTEADIKDGLQAVRDGQ